MSVAKNFQGLPIEHLIGAPLRAACDSQRQLAASAYEFMTQIGFDGDKPRLLSFDLERPIQDSTETSKVTVNAPFIGLVPIPALLIEDVKIEFQMEVSDSATEKSNTNAEASISAEASYKKGPVQAKVNVAGKVSSSRENTRTTNQTAKYQITVQARQQAPTEGLSKLMDLLASAIEPLPKSA